MRPVSPPALAFVALAPALLCGCPGKAALGGNGSEDMHVGGGDMAVHEDMGPLVGPDIAITLNSDMGGACATIPGPSVRIVDNISVDTTLPCDRLYLFSGTIFVDHNATLTIAPGTTIMMASDASLVITPGAKIMAVGTRDLPIVFTSTQLPGSRAPRDWGAVVLVGNAAGNWGLDGSGNPVTVSARADANGWPTNDGIDKFPIPTGASGDMNDSSGQMSYVRLEYGGYIRNQYGTRDHEMLALYGVGRGTTLSYIDMRQADFECLFAEGGAFYAHHLVCQWSGNGGFGFSRGNQSEAQFLFDQEAPTKEAEGVGIKGPFDGNTALPRTNPTIYNVTVCGTNGSPQTVKDPWGLFLRRNPAGKVYNMIATGFKAGVASTGGNGNTITELHSSIFFHNFDPAQPGVDTNIYSTMPVDDFDSGNLSIWFNTPGWNNQAIDPMLPDCFNADKIGALPATSITSNAAQPPADGFFNPNANYIGAFKDQNDTWATGNWISWSSK